MHALQPAQSKLKPEEADKLLKELNISTTQLPKMKVNDPTLDDSYKVGDIVKIERKDMDTGKTIIYYRVVSV
jgi:DNA-directed RNA polymerase subunit H (RpoH/RPB5)